VPSEPIAGEDHIEPPVLYFHFRVPLGFIQELKVRAITTVKVILPIYLTHTFI